MYIFLCGLSTNIREATSDKKFFDLGLKVARCDSEENVLSTAITPVQKSLGVMENSNTFLNANYYIH